MGPGRVLGGPGLAASALVLAGRLLVESPGEQSAGTCTLQHLRLQLRLLTAPYTPPPPHAP